jgi:hypothetical protein
MMYGELPTSPVVFAACDSEYFMKFAPAFVESIAKNTNKDIHIHVINPTDHVLSLSCILNAIVTKDTRITYTFTDVDLSELDDAQTRALYASTRFMLLPPILQSARKVMILDIDCMVMREFEYPEKAVGYFPRESLPGTVGWEAEGTKVAAGAFYLDDRALSVAEGISKVLGELPLQWFNDQIALSSVINSIQTKDEITTFDNQFMDWEFKEGTTIWTGKGPRKYENETYVSKQEEYTQSVMDIISNINETFDQIILKPRLDIPFKRMGLTRANSVKEPIREHWKNFIEKATINNKSLVIESPRWMFNNTIQEYFAEMIMLVPHVEKHNWGGNDYTRYYMQTVFPWLFTVDTKGWAGGADYVSTYDSEMEYSDDSYLRMKKMLGNGKFGHLQHNNVDWSVINKDNYIIVPLQLPHDETIKYHSNVSVEEFVRAICEWATSTDDEVPQIVFKGHPVNLASMEPLKQIIAEYSNDSKAIVYTDVGNFNQLVENAKCMFVLNGGSGQEAMLHGIPVACFADCDYSPAVFRGDVRENGSISAAYQALMMWEKDLMLESYKRWYHWYLKDVTYNTLI